MDRFDALRLIALLLGPSRLPADAGGAFAAGRVDWERLAEVASHHLVTPALKVRLGQRALDDHVPEDFREYLDAIHQLNLARNEELADLLHCVLVHFANENIPVVLLKGAISLTQDLYPEPGMRMMSDLDLLVPHAEAARAFALLQAAGFRSWRDTTRRALPENHHHLTELVNETLVAAQVELHTEPVARRCGGTLPAEQVFADAVAYRWRDRDILIPSLAHRILHNVLHSQLADGDFRARRINLRHLHEFDRLLQCGDAASLAQTIGRSLPRHQFPIWDAHTALHRVLFLAEPLALHPGAGGFMRRARLHSRLPFGFAAARIGATWLDSARHLLQRPGLHLPKLVDAGWYARRWQSLKNQWQERR